jgi:predicted MFS family arabinose efflux permease
VPQLSSKATKAWVLALASTASCMVALDSLVVTAALSTIRRDLGASMETLEWTVNAYNLRSRARGKKRARLSNGS